MSDVTNHQPNGKRLSALAQLVRLLMRDGFTTTAALVAETGYSERAIWKAKSELRDTEAECTVHPSALKQSADVVHRSAVQGAAECSSQQPETRARAYKESLRDKILPRSLESPLYPPDPYAQAWIGEDGRLVLTDKFRSDWLNRFDGDKERFDLALVQAQGYVQPNNRSKSLDVQISAQLARMIADKRDRDSRYAKAAERKLPAKDSPGFVDRAAAKRAADLKYLQEIGWA